MSDCITIVATYSTRKKALEAVLDSQPLKGGKFRDEDDPCRGPLRLGSRIAVVVVNPPEVVVYEVEEDDETEGKYKLDRVIDFVYAKLPVELSKPKPDKDCHSSYRRPCGTRRPRCEEPEKECYLFYNTVGLETEKLSLSCVEGNFTYVYVQEKHEIKKGQCKEEEATVYCLDPSQTVQDPNTTGEKDVNFGDVQGSSFKGVSAAFNELTVGRLRNNSLLTVSAQAQSTVVAAKDMSKAVMAAQLTRFSYANDALLAAIAAGNAAFTPAGGSTEYNLKTQAGIDAALLDVLNQVQVVSGDDNLHPGSPFDNAAYDANGVGHFPVELPALQAGLVWALNGQFTWNFQFTDDEDPAPRCGTVNLNRREIGTCDKKTIYELLVCIPGAGVDGGQAILNRLQDIRLTMTAIKETRNPAPVPAQGSTPTPTPTPTPDDDDCCYIPYYCPPPRCRPYRRPQCDDSDDE